MSSKAKSLDDRISHSFVAALLIFYMTLATQVFSYQDLDSLVQRVHKLVKSYPRLPTGLPDTIFPPSLFAALAKELTDCYLG